MRAPAIKLDTERSLSAAGAYAACYNCVVYVRRLCHRKYVGARTVLPPDLLRAVQEYVREATISIPVLYC